MKKKYTYLACLAISIPDYKDEIQIGKYKVRKRTKEELIKYYNVEKVKLDK